jgi:plasmid stabilization system protein ParE
MALKSYRLKITPEAQDEIQHAVDYYNDQQKGLGKEFFTDLKDDLLRIRRNPSSFSVRYDEVRWVSMKRFPYAIHFTIADQKGPVIIQAVLSHHQDPASNWKRRE